MLNIMDAVADAALTTGALIEGIINAGYRSSSSNMEYSINRSMTSVDKMVGRREDRRRRYHRYMCMIGYLKTNGLIKEKKVGDTIKLHLTGSGRAKLEQIKKEKLSRIPTSGYEASPGKKVIIVTYDISEKRARYRDWLREVLSIIGLKKLQRSVWVGRVLVPQALLDDLIRYRLEESVEIIEVGSSGIMRELL